ncbi:MAG TPA: hypothetical protein PKE64_30490 [Anaerolineae bacterium]|nr:hypothetical protein [Anaerolineae bacterium]
MTLASIYCGIFMGRHPTSIGCRILKRLSLAKFDEQINAGKETLEQAFHSVGDTSRMKGYPGVNHALMAT